jgi:nitronate monooxygenase
MTTPKARAAAFCARFGLRLPILLAPMAGACPPSLSIAVANAGGMGACGVLLMQPDAIAAWAREVRAASNGAFQLNSWIPDAAPIRDPAHEALLRDFLGNFGPAVAEDAGDKSLVDFDAQCTAMLAAGPAVISSIMGLYPAPFVAAMRAQGTAWFATVTTVAEALAAAAAGADALVAQGSEAGGHRGAFKAGDAERAAIGLFALLPAVANAVDIPIIAAGGIADARGIAAALMLGASAVQIGTGLLRTPEAKIAPAWATALATTRPEDTVVTRAFSGRAGRSIATDYTRAANTGPAPAPYPIQRGLTAAMRDAATKASDVQHMQAWAGQSAAMARAEPAADLLRNLWSDATALLGNQT